MTNTFLQGDALDVLKNLPSRYVNCCVTSPPYWGLRDYGVPGQIGLEDNPKAYINKLVSVFREVRRVLKDNGTLWLNMGDCYAGSGKAGYNPEYQKKHTQFNSRVRKETLGKPVSAKKIGLKPKDLVGIPWMLAFALRTDGWYLRSDIIWYKPNPMPESVGDRPSKAHEYIFLLSKSKKYYYDADAIKEPYANSTYVRLSQKNIKNQRGSLRANGGMKTNGPMKARGHIKTGGKYNNNKNYGGGGSRFEKHSGYFDKDGNLIGTGMRNKRTVWIVTTQPFKEAHFATFPIKLIVPCIRAGCPESGIVLDPFIGSGTTALVAKLLCRNFVGIEINPEYIKIAEDRLMNEIPLFMEEIRNGK
ncbi:MAG: site-specific DNA-methyltransferase [Spirochaetales bacterium]|nr:site-specific DNA-methyltransferase [Spirochaetales bacterium]